MRHRPRQAVFAALLVALLTGVCEAAPVAASGAARPAHGVVYSGGTQHKAPFSLDITADGHSIAVAESVWTGNCFGQEPKQDVLFQPYWPNIAVEAGGHFHASIQRDVPAGAGYTFEGTLQITGHFVTSAKAIGTFTDHEVVSDGTDTVATCDSGTVRWTALGVGGYSGPTSQQGGVSIDIAPNAKKVVAWRAFFHATCSNGNTVDSYIWWNNLAVRSGTFKKSETDHQHQGGGSQVATYSMTGRFASATQLQGTFTWEGTITPAGGGTPSDCHTGHVTWKAHSKTPASSLHGFSTTTTTTGTN
ncbi:MAG: hypothetical protein ACRDVW_01225 [Acidimicrobiales bacterium]